MRSLFTRCLAAVLACFFACGCALAAPSFIGERIEGNPEELRSAHEDYVLEVLGTLALYATDDKSAGAVRRYTLKGSRAEEAVDRFDGGWFTGHRKVTFENGRTENYEGDGTNEFSCDVYMDCIVEISKDEVMVYDLAYNFEFTCPDPASDDARKWKLTRFTNLPTEADRIDLDALNAIDSGLTVEHVTGPTFKGYLLTVTDPSRVYVGTSDRPFDAERYGWQLDDFAEHYGASAVINGGGFADPNGMGKGGKPNGIVVSQGEWIQNHSGGETFGTIIGFDENNKLVVRSDIERGGGKDLALRDAVAFSPALIIDGQPVDNTSYRTELSARSAIGQRADGAVLMLIVDGRQPDSFGSAMGALTELLLEKGAVVAANLDGGTSTALVMHGKKVNDGSAPSRVSRYMPTAFIVK